MASKKLWSDKKEWFKKKLHSWTVMVFSYTNNISWMKSSKLSKFHSSELSKFHTKIGVSTIEIDFCLLIFSSEKILEKRLFRELLWCWRSFTFRVDKLIWVQWGPSGVTVSLSTRKMKLLQYQKSLQKSRFPRIFFSSGDNDLYFNSIFVCKIHSLCFISNTVNEGLVSHF